MPEHVVMKPFFETHALHFSCTRCGRCCATPGDYFVFLSAQEAERIRIQQGLSVSWFRRRYLRRIEDGQLVLASGTDDRCIFLDGQGRCSIYAVRPVQCRTYPFWPEIAGTRSAWCREGRRCEGIDRGGVVPVRRIRRAINACLAE
jgi:Fe-S-cluster containining protein